MAPDPWTQSGGVTLQTAAGRRRRCHRRQPGRRASGPSGPSGQSAWGAVVAAMHRPARCCCDAPGRSDRFLNFMVCGVCVVSAAAALEKRRTRHAVVARPELRWRTPGWPAKALATALCWPRLSWPLWPHPPHRPPPRTTTNTSYQRSRTPAEWAPPLRRHGSVGVLRRTRHRGKQWQEGSTRRSARARPAHRPVSRACAHHHPRPSQGGGTAAAIPV